VFRREIPAPERHGRRANNTHMTRIRVREVGGRSHALNARSVVTVTNPPPDDDSLPAGLMFTPGHDTYDIPKEGRAFGILCETVGTVDGNARKTSIPHLNEGGPVTFTVEVSADGEKTVEGHFTAILPDNELYAEVHRAT
jgi:hypothetical protein